MRINESTSIVILAVCLAIFSCGQSSPSKLNVAVASSLKHLFDSIMLDKSLTDKHIEVFCTYGASGMLATQIQNGLPQDIFVSADSLYVQNVKKKLDIKQDAHCFLSSQLGLFSNLTILFDSTLNILLSDSIKNIIIPKETVSPYGKKFVKILKDKKIYDKLKSKFIYAESAHQVLHLYNNSKNSVAITAYHLKSNLEKNNLKSYYAISEKKYCINYYILTLNKKKETLYLDSLIRHKHFNYLIKNI